ncbi:hypothetical protein LIER_22060 [Lithospermum erythrorhizon]|uniref:Uncharacterized protein n=1 Tax=Lithospermum erythrorhizon TaxID=34254 RepID=A0AAV3QSM1_LITER
MSITIMSGSESILLSAAESQPPDVDCVKCDCCGLTEECTIEYIEKIRECYQGKWICGLCAEAIKDEAGRCERMMISSDEALSRHLSFCKTFQSSMSPPPDPTIRMIAAMRQILRRSLESPKMRSMPCSPTRDSNRGLKRWALTRSESCIPTLSLVDGSDDDHGEEVV